MELLLSLVIGAAVACVIFAVGRFLLRSEQPLAQTEAIAEEAKVPAEPVAERPAKVVPMDAIPRCIAFLDVETTGLAEKDRIVTLAGVKITDTELLATENTAKLEYVYLIFDPGKKSHPRAEAVHGYSDWVLRHQDTFGAYAETIESFFSSADLAVAHNAEFDFGFFNREMERASRPPIAKPTFCTMEAYRQRGFAGSCSLDAACQRIGAARTGQLHGALEDAWLAMRVYLWLNHSGFSGNLPTEFARGPFNLKPAPPLAIGPLPRRRRRTKEATVPETELGTPAAIGGSPRAAARDLQ